MRLGSIVLRQQWRTHKGQTDFIQSPPIYIAPVRSGREITSAGFVSRPGIGARTMRAGIATSWTITTGIMILAIADRGRSVRRNAPTAESIGFEPEITFHEDLIKES